MAGTHLDRFIEAYSKELEEENAAVFAGAGLSMAAGFVDWRGLLAPLAAELELDVERESDLVALAQYHCNENQDNRSQLTKILLEEFTDRAELTENHRVLARLPLATFWTTNYDTLIEDALRGAGKRPDIKYTNAHLAQTRPKRDAVVYKMHGDIAHPDGVILTKDDYESYHNKFQPFINALSGDLVAKTFLFIGFSFTDPNLDYVLSRIRVTYGKNQRRHYCLLKEIEKKQGEADEDFEYRRRKQRLFINDLKRFNIHTLELDSYSQITIILSRLEARYRRNSVFLSGAAHDYGDWGREKSEAFLSDLGRRLIGEKCRIVTGVGLGVGSAVLSGALNELYMKLGQPLLDEIIMCPFPQSDAAATPIAELWERHRQNMVDYAGIAIFVFGNKLKDGQVVPSDGVEREFQIAHEKGLSLVPVGATGSIALTLWQRVMKDFDTYYPDDKHGLKKLFEKIGKPEIAPEALVHTLIEIVKKLKAA
jgi:hypothetical protein